ncbi:putative retrotransposon ty1-copia subclass protein, partial [Tanacetum coccineum]
MACKPKPRASICAFVLEMKGYVDRLESLNMVFDAELSINIILYGKATKGKSDRVSKRKAELEIAPTSDPKEAMCLNCNTKGHWKRSYPKYLKELKDGKVKKGSNSGLKESRRLKHEELNLVMGNRKITPVTWIGKCELMLKSRVVTPVKPSDISLPIRKTSGRVSKTPQFYYGFHIEEDKISDSTLSELDKPANYKEAMASVEAAKWKEAMKSEIQFMINYEETFSPVAKIKSIRIMLAIAAFNDYEIWQMDVKTTFLNGKLIEDVFMAQPKGFENAKYPKR